MSDHKTCLKKFKKTDIIPSIFSNHNGINNTTQTLSTCYSLAYKVLTTYLPFEENTNGSKLHTSDFSHFGDLTLPTHINLLRFKRQENTSYTNDHLLTSLLLIDTEVVTRL